jgi:hypothetical protein
LAGKIATPIIGGSCESPLQHLPFLNFTQGKQKKPVTLCVTGMLPHHSTHRISVNFSDGKCYRQAVDRDLVSQHSAVRIDLVAFSAVDRESA